MRSSNPPEYRPGLPGAPGEDWFLPEPGRAYVLNDNQTVIHDGTGRVKIVEQVYPERSDSISTGVVMAVLLFVWALAVAYGACRFFGGAL